MRLTTVSRAAGLRLARDLPATGPGRVPLLAHGALITERYQRALLAQGIHAVWVEDDLSDGIEPVELLPETVRAETAERVRGALASARTAFGSSQRLPPATMQDLAGIVDRIASSIMDNPDAALVVGDLAAADQYIYRHSVNVTALGLLLARAQFRRNGWVDYRGQRRYDRIDQRLATLGLGLLLHDIGKMAVPAPVLNKPGPLDDDEWDLMRSHPEAGAALLGTSTMSPLVTAVVRDHHERMDGSGYPRGIEGADIHPFARLAAVADVYDAITSARPYQEAAPPRAGVKVIADGERTAFDPEVVETFRRVVFPYPVGTEIELSDGRVGVVARVDPEAPDVPVIRVAGADGPQELATDLRTELTP
jgi:HD-GYP domain-containing protein (c-di-GMP phosphodiesterase class II)